MTETDTHPINTLIFDFDGLIFDSETPDYESWRATYADFGLTLPLDVWQANIGSEGLFNPYLHLEKMLGRPIDRDAVYKRRKALDNELLAQQTILPGVEAYIQSAKALGLTIGIASSSPHDWVESNLDRLGIPHDTFAVIACRDDVDNRSKPDPAVYNFAVQALQANPARTLALEDSPNGVAAARAAGLWVTAVPNTMTRPLDFSHAHHVLDALTAVALPDLLARFK